MREIGLLVLRKPSAVSVLYHKIVPGTTGTKDVEVAGIRIVCVCVCVVCAQFSYSV